LAFFHRHASLIMALEDLGKGWSIIGAIQPAELAALARQ
jgi:hypothetical protein